MKTPVTKKAIQDHFTYSSWKYALLAVLAIFGVNIIYTTTAYRPPDEKKIILGIYSLGSSENIDAYMEAVRREKMPDMEDMSSQYILPDATYGSMILSTRFAARECDLYILPRTEFQGYASQSGFMPLDVVLPDLAADLEAANISLSRGWRTDDTTHEKHLFGIPCKELPGMSHMIGANAEDMFISVFFETGNDENVLIFFEQFVRDMMLEPTVLNSSSN